MSIGGTPQTAKHRCESLRNEAQERRSCAENAQYSGCVPVLGEWQHLTVLCQVCRTAFTSLRLHTTKCRFDLLEICREKEKQW